MATSKSHNTGAVKDTCKMFATLHQTGGFLGRAIKRYYWKFLLDLPLLPWQQADVIWTQNRPLLSLYKRHHQDSCTK